MTRNKITFACMDLDEAEYDLLCTLLRGHVAWLEERTGQSTTPPMVASFRARFDAARKLLEEMESQDGRKEER
jgi:hypothetical protein